MENNAQLVEHLVRTRAIRSERIRNAFERVDRADFLPAEQKTSAYENGPLPIGAGQTISQPAVVAFMLELLRPQPGHRVLDIGSGSGWTTALLAELVKPDGYVWGVERIPELVERGRKNVQAYAPDNAEIRPAHVDNIGLPEEAPFDRIHGAAAAHHVPNPLLKQLRAPGILTVPVRDTITVVRTDEAGHVTRDAHHGFAFVPLITNE